MTTLGKRHRNSSSSMRRTTSMSGFAVADEEEQPPPPQQGICRQPARAARSGGRGGPGWGAAMQRRHSGDFAVAETAAFLKACGICNRRLGPGRDTFIYMGEVAFCSHECRQQQMNIDELKEKKCFQQESGGGGGSGGSDKSGNSGAVAAA
ncbi:FCS-Like Zinc finger 6-like [Oryza brachyantha]|uniref:FCS-Like Zinc finger 6-like n=1 Tax=Oryza brachyantha TaxID=4533 RepID=UPI001ADBCF87|nr:FCS-Like Zinc finger 6-like [Oryza brachyantha]